MDDDRPTILAPLQGLRLAFGTHSGLAFPLPLPPPAVPVVSRYAGDQVEDLIA